MLKTTTTGNIPPVSQLNAEVDPALAAICGKAMVLKQSGRYSSAAALADESVTAFQELWLMKVGRFVKLHNTAAATTVSPAAACLVGLAVISGIVTVKNRVLSVAYDRILGEQKRLQSTRDDFRLLAFDVLDAAENQLTSTRGIEAFRNGVMEQSFETFQQLRKDAPDDLRVAREFLRSARLSGNQMARNNNCEGASPRLVLAIDLQQGLMTG